MSQLIQDVFIIENLQVISEGKGNGKTVVKGIFGRCNETNKNGRMYPTAVLEGQLKKVQPLINERRLCGELDHPSNDTVKLANASHLITKLEMKGDELIGEAEILGTPAGLTAKALIEAGVCIGISSRGMGTLSEDANGNKVVNDDFRLVTFDLVADPSTRGAFPALAESTESRFARTSQSKLKKEQNFVTMLQEKLRESYDPWIEEAKKGKCKCANGKKTCPECAKSTKKKGSFPDLTGDGKVTKADILKGRGVFEGMEAVKAEGSWHQIAYTIAEGLGLKKKTELEEDAAAEAEAEEKKKDQEKEKEQQKPQRPSSVAKELQTSRVGKSTPTSTKPRDTVQTAKDDVKAARIRTRGEIKIARERDRAAAGEPVTGMERAVDRTKKIVKGAASIPGRVVRGASQFSDAAKTLHNISKDKRRQRRRAVANNANRGGRLGLGEAYMEIGFQLAEGLDLVEMRDKTIADQEARAEDARLKAWKAGKKSKQDVMAQYRRISKKIGKRYQQKLQSEEIFKGRNVARYTQSAEEKRLKGISIDDQEKRKAPQNRYQAGMSKDQKAKANRELDVQLKQSGKRL